jgi:hypothetical protein
MRVLEYLNKASGTRFKGLLEFLKIAVEIVGLIFLIRYTTFAGRQVDAAQKQVDIAQHVYDASNRPYVGVSSTMALFMQAKPQAGLARYTGMRTRDSNAMQIRLEVKNFGSVPAINMVLDWKLFKDGVEQKGERVPDQSHTLMPGQPTYLQAQIPPAVYPPIANGQSKLEIEVRWQYEGLTGTTYRSCEREQYAYKDSAFLNLGTCQ